MGLLDSLKTVANGANTFANGAVSSPLFQLGTALMAGGTGLNNPGQALQQVYPNMLAQKQAQLQLQQQQMQMQMLPMLQQALAQSGYLGGSPPSQGASGAPAQQPASLTQSPTGPVSTFGLGNAPPAGAPAQQSPAQPQGLMPQQQDPFQLLRTGTALSAFPMTQKLGAAMMDQAKTMIANNPQLVTQRAAAGAQLAQDQYALQQAQASGNPMLAKAAQMKLLTDSKLVNVANNNGAVTTFGGLDPASLGMSGVNPAQGYQLQNGRETAIPGAPQAQAAVEGARAGAESAAQYAPVYDSNGNQIGFAPRGSILSQMPAAPGATPAAGANFGLSPGGQKLSEGQGEEANETLKEYQDQAEAAKDLQTQVQQIRQSAQAFGPGKFSGVRGEFLNLMNSAGLISPQDQQRLGSLQEGNKISIQLQAAVTKQLGSREAAQVFSKMGQSIPNLTMTQNGLDKVTSYLDGMARYNAARAAKAQQLGNQNDVAGVNNVRQDFLANTNPAYYIVASAPPAVQREMVQSMKDPKGFMKSWAKAQQAGYAPSPTQYAGQ